MYGTTIGIIAILIGIQIILIAVAYAIFIMRRKGRRGEKEKDEVEEVIGILKEARRIKEEIERRGRT